MTHKAPRSSMKQMLDERNAQGAIIAKAQYHKRAVEDGIIIELLRDNDHRFLTVSWRRLERHIYGK